MSDLSDFAPLVVKLDILDNERLDNGEISEEALNSMNLFKWSDLVKSCETCDTPVDNLIELNSHHEATHIARIVQISCTKCPRKFKKIFGIMNHVEKHPEMEHLTHSCIICEKIFCDLSLLNDHVTSTHPEYAYCIFQCFICGQFMESSDSLVMHYQSVHLKIVQPAVVVKRRIVVEPVARRPKRVKREEVIKFEEVTDTEVESVNDYDEENSSDDQNSRMRRRSRKEAKNSSGRRRSNNPQKPPADFYGPEIDTFDKLFADEINGTSNLIQPLHLNVSEEFQLSDGEVPDEHTSKIGTLRWKDFLNCGICKLKFNDINELTEHADSGHSTRAKLFSCISCDGEFNAMCESPLINHLIERHFYEHLRFCCLVCSKMFYNLPSLRNHYRLHEDKFEFLTCLICGWYAKTFDDLKEHKAYHETIDKSENQILCEKVLEKFSTGAEAMVRNHCVAEYEKNADGTVKEEFHTRFLVDWSFGRYDCATCKENFPNPFQLFVHQRLKHPKDIFKKNYTCSLCFDKKEYSNLFTFVNHATVKHLDSGKFTCIVCSRVYWNYLDLANHYKNVHPAFPCVFCCHCGKIFMNVTVASSHFKTLNLLRTPEERRLLKEGKIQEEMSHICHVCARSFKNRGTLLNHVKTHEVLEPADLLQCHICSKLWVFMGWRNVDLTHFYLFLLFPIIPATRTNTNLHNTWFVMTTSEVGSAKPAVKLSITKNFCSDIFR